MDVLTLFSVALDLLLNGRCVIDDMLVENAVKSVLKHLKDRVHLHLLFLSDTNVALRLRFR